jgi:hypothetical protein
VGGKPEATPIFPYRDESAERDRFAATFMVTERNLTKEAEAKENGKKPRGRFKNFTAEVCNVHRLWKLFGPIILRRRKQDAGVEIVPKSRSSPRYARSSAVRWAPSRRKFINTTSKPTSVRATTST